jgi:hypothetical protein
MDWKLKYGSAFGIGALAGIANEVVQNPNHWCITKPNPKALVTCTVGNMYGWATVVAVAMFDVASRHGVPAWAQIAIATIGVAAMEGVGGWLSRRFHDGEQKWEYPPCWYPILGGYVSLVSTAYFGIGIAAFYFLVYKPLLR